MLWLYNIGIQLYGLIIYLLSPFSAKASFFIKGRKDIFKRITTQIDLSKPHIWFHFASLGEFEQGRPVLEKIKSCKPDKRIIITFFSPSGYEVRKNYALAEGVFYLPLDTKNNALKFITAINPEIAVFTKYEYWYHYFKVLNNRQIPLFIISGIFRADQIYFKWYGSFNRKILRFVKHFFVQNEESEVLLNRIDLQNVSLSGDTRFDRVFENAKIPKSFPLVENFCNNSRTFIAGSTWFPDEDLITTLTANHTRWKFIIAPHEIDKEHIINLQKLFPGSIKYSELTDAPMAQVLIIDNIGLLSSLYQYADIAYIGGGFGAGIHNTLEAAAFGIPVIFGPKYRKFQEAKDLVASGAAISIQSKTELIGAFENFKSNTSRPGEIAKRYVEAKTGSTSQIVDYLITYL